MAAAFLTPSIALLLKFSSCAQDTFSVVLINAGQKDLAICFFLVSLWIILLAQNSFPVIMRVRSPVFRRSPYFQICLDLFLDITETQECPKLVLIRFSFSYDSVCVLLHPTLKVQ